MRWRGKKVPTSVELKKSGKPAIEGENTKEGSLPGSGGGEPPLFEGERHRGREGSTLSLQKKKRRIPVGFEKVHIRVDRQEKNP